MSQKLPQVLDALLTGCPPRRSELRNSFRESSQQTVEFIDGLLSDGIVGEALGQSAFGVHDRRVVAMAETAANVGVAERGQPAGQVDGDVAGFDERGAPRRANQGGLGERVKTGRNGDDLFELGEVVLMI